MNTIGISGLAHLFGILAIILLLVWLLHYREGIDYDSDNGFRVFNVNLIIIFSCGFVFSFLTGSFCCHILIATAYVWCCAGSPVNDVLGVYFPCWWRYQLTTSSFVVKLYIYTYYHFSILFFFPLLPLFNLKFKFKNNYTTVTAKLLYNNICNKKERRDSGTSRHFVPGFLVTRMLLIFISISFS